MLHKKLTSLLCHLIISEHNTNMNETVILGLHFEIAERKRGGAQSRLRNVRRENVVK